MKKKHFEFLMKMSLLILINNDFLEYNTSVDFYTLIHIVIAQILAFYLQIQYMQSKITERIYRI